MNLRPHPVEVVMPGEFLKEELDARGLSQQELADILGRPPRVISEIIGGKRAITPQTAMELAEALNISAHSWLALENAFQLSRLRLEDNAVRRKAHLYETYPVRELLRRGWISASDNLDSLESRFCEFFDIKDPSQRPQLPHAAKKTHAQQEPTVEQLAWLFRVRQIAKNSSVPVYSHEKLRDCIRSLEKLRSRTESIGEVPCLLHRAGVHLIFVEPIAGARLDGACLWVGSRPVVGMSLRFDRIDNFWFVLRHEIEHILREDGKEVPILDSEVGSLDGEQSKAEKVANEAAAEFCFPQKVFKKYVEDASPFFAEESIVNLAAAHDVHPGLLVGQLQRHLDRYDILRKYQVKVRGLLVGKAPTDGWGITATTSSPRNL
jgi:HTH-type transcriptional regulator / antitoxin HigA